MLIVASYYKLLQGQSGKKDMLGMLGHVLGKNVEREQMTSADIWEFHDPEVDCTQR